MTEQIVFYDNSGAAWVGALYAFLAEKERRAGSGRTVGGYSRMIQHIFGRLGKPTDQVASQDVFAWAHSKGLSGKDPSAVTIGARMAWPRSFCKSLFRMEIVTSNPYDALERPRISHSPPRGLSADEIRRLPAVIPERKVGLRDRAIVLTLTLTGRRRTEVLSLTRNGISQQCETAYYSYRGKAGKQAKRELPRAALDAAEEALAAWGKCPDDAVRWIASFGEAFVGARGMAATRKGPVGSYKRGGDVSRRRTDLLPSPASLFHRASIDSNSAIQVDDCSTRGVNETNSSCPSAATWPIWRSSVCSSSSFPTRLSAASEVVLVFCMPSSMMDWVLRPRSSFAKLIVGDAS